MMKLEILPKQKSNKNLEDLGPTLQQQQLEIYRKSIIDRINKQHKKNIEKNLV